MGNSDRKYVGKLERVLLMRVTLTPLDKFFFFFLISNKTSLIIKKRHPSTQGVYKGEQIKNENYKSQVNPKEKKNGFSTQRTIQVRFGKRQA